MEPWVIAVAIGLPVALLAFLGGREFQRRTASRTGAEAVEALRQARLDAQRILSRAEEESRALAESYREREEAALAHRHVEADALEERLVQREATLEQRATNLAHREEMLLEKERSLGEVRSETEALREEARSHLERIAGFDSRAASLQRKFV